MIHLVYPHDPARIAAPWSIGNHLARGIRAAGHHVAQYDWAESVVIEPEPDVDILLGHPHPAAGHVFRNSAMGPWGKVIAISPWNGSDEYTDNLTYVYNSVDHLLCICGEYWAGQLPWKCGGVSAIDMAVEPLDFSPLEFTFRPPGQRKLLYIGCTLPIKNPEKIAAVADKYTVGHCGYGSIPGTVHHGHVDFSTEEGRAIVSEYDFLLMLSDHDANPTTVLEAMSWGIIPLCSQGSGYVSPDVVVVDSASVLDYWQHASPDKLLDRQELGWSIVKDKYTWDRFVTRVMEVI